MANQADEGARGRLPGGPWRGTGGDLVKFTGLVALLAIFADAAVGHALLWENDPYWTYWITKTLLIATVFGLGTAWIGIGTARGAVITTVHTLILTVYYWSLSPVGLPSHPEWLDLEHTWLTGVPVHFGVIYLGYLLALWLWRRRGMLREVPEEPGSAVSRMVGEATIVAVALVLAGGLVVSAVLWEFPGVTWFVVRLLLTVPFVAVWWVLAGRERLAAIVGGITLAFLWGAYSHFLGPIGLPDIPVRVFSEPPPPATVTWLDYRQEWLTSVPLLVVVFSFGLWLAARQTGAGRNPAPLRPVGVLGVTVAVLSVGLGIVAWQQNPPGGDRATVESAGAAQVERGEWYSGDFVDASGELRLEAQDRNPRVTPLPPHDGVELVATVEHAGGTAYEVRATQPLVDDPLGRHTTWWGVGLHEWHHGDSGIGSSALPSVRSEVAVFLLGDVYSDGTLVAAGVPVHVMTVGRSDLPHRLELHVGDPAVPVVGLPDDRLRVVWDDYTGGAPQGPKRARNALGSGVLVGLLALLGLTLRQELRAGTRT